MNNKYFSVSLTISLAIFMLIRGTTSAVAEDYVVKHKSKEMGEVISQLLANHRFRQEQRDLRKRDE